MQKGLVCVQNERKDEDEVMAALLRGLKCQMKLKFPELILQPMGIHGRASSRGEVWSKPGDGKLSL